MMTFYEHYIGRYLGTKHWANSKTLPGNIRVLPTLNVLLPLVTHNKSYQAKKWMNEISIYLSHHGSYCQLGAVILKLH